jgi:hypothetical protein
MRERASSKRFARKRIAKSASTTGLTTESSSSDLPNAPMLKANGRLRTRPLYAPKADIDCSHALGRIVPSPSVRSVSGVMATVDCPASPNGNAMKFPRRKFLRLLGSLIAFPTVSRIAMAQAYPARAVRLIIGYPPGGSADITARLMAQWLSERLGQPFVIENRPGAGTNLATEAAVRAAPDGSRSSSLLRRTRSTRHSMTS